MVGYSLKPHALTATLARGYRGKKHKHPANRWEDNKGPPHESSTIYMHNKIITKILKIKTIYARIKNLMKILEIHARIKKI